MVMFQHIARDASPKESKRLQTVTVRVCVTDCTGEVYITDLLLQAGAVATGWVGNVCEILWTLDGQPG
ncbi:hypothetical protein LJC74_05760 [Eubacteriales bacterium OttesenSCG-928-A19]|nr:hypothetical protein [Eubacteriales bacterium OttesenSCG-928-A19]